MYFTQKISLRTLLLIAILAGGLFDGLGLAGIIDVWAFSRQWGESWGSDHRGDWDEYKIGDCGGQNHSVSGGALHMDASYGTDCFGAYYRENGNHPGMFPRNQDIRVMWRWRYPDREKYGSQAGQVTGRYGGPQYYGMSAVDTGGSGNSNDSWHVVTQGPWGTQTVDNSPKYGTDTGWHVSTFDWLCDGAMMKWWLDNDNFQTRSSSSYALPANHESRPWQFWQGNLMTSVPGSGSWTPFDIDYLHIYAVERPQLNTPTSGGGGVQPVSWSSVPNATQPDGTAWGVQYQVQACNNSSCSSIQQSSPWLDSTSYTFTGLPLNQTYTYRARARWLGTPSLETCWGNSVSASMTGAPKLELSQLAPAQAQYGDTIIYSLTVKNTGDAPATNVVVTDSPPAYVRLPGSSPSPGSPMAVQVFNGGSYSNGQIRWQIGSLAPGQRVTVSWWTGLEAAVPPAIDQLTNTPRATADGGLDVSAPATTQILHPNISLTKSGPATSFPGDTISYQIEVENTGSGRALESWLFDTTAAGFDQPNGDLETVRDISPDGSYIGAIDQLDGVSFTAVCDEPQDQVWYVGSAKPTLVWSFDRLEAGDKQTLTFSAAVNPDLTGGSAIDNKAQLCHWHTGPEPGDLASTPLIAPQLDLSKSAPAEIWVGDPFSYQITAHNSGSVPVVEPAIYDIVPDYIINPTNISEGYGLSSSIDPFGDVTMTIGWDEPQRLEPGQAATYRWDFAVDPDTPADVTEITNHALATAAGGLSEQAQAVSTLLFAVMELSKSATPVVYPGAPISYTIRVANSGGAVMQQVVITDTIPPYVTGISGISHGGQRLGDEIVWHLANIAGSSQLDLSWHGQIDPNIPRYETEIINRVAGTALATGDTAETHSSLTYPQMTLTKSGPANSSPGQPLEYTLVVENSGDAPMLDVSVRDPVPAYLVDVDVPAGTLTGGVADWEFSRLEPGERQELIWRATVAPDIPDNISLILNRASGTALGGIEERAEAATSLQFPRLTLDKQAPAEVWPGGQIEYAVHVENSGVVALEELVIRDFIPDYVLDPVDISHGGLVDGQEIVWQLGDLAPGAAYDLVWRGTVDPAIPQARSVIRNQVQGRAAHGVSRVAEATSLVLFPALVVGKQGPAQAGPGDPVQYVIEVHNASAAPVDGVVVVDHIPEYITQPGSISGGGRVEGADIIWELGRLGGGQSRTLLWEGVIDGAVPLGRSYLDNTVTVCDESGRFCDEALYRMPLLQAEARLTKAATPYGHPGSEVEYVIRLQNRGETVLEELVIRDPLPPYLEYPHDISGGGQALPSPFEDEIAVVWRLERLAVGELVELRWRGRIALDIPPGVDAIQNEVTVTDRRGLQREAAGSTYVMHPQLRLRKQATPQAGPGEEIDYTLTLENPGQVPAYEVELVDLIPTYILTPTQISGGGLLQAADISWRFAELAAGQVVSLTWQGTVDPQIPAAVEQIANTARASNPAGLLAEDTALTDLSGQLLALRKTATAMVEPGGEVLYELEIENRGQAAVTGLTLTDPIPAYVESPAEISGGGSAANNVAVSWEIERLEAGQTYRVGWQGVVARDIPAKEAEILNEARLTSASGLALTTQARSLVQQPLLALDKSATLTAGPGEVITTVLTVRNLGGGTAYDVAVSDPLPAYLTAESGGPGVELAADRVTWALVGGLLPGASRSLTWTGRVDPFIPFDQTEIVNEATATASGGQLATAQAVTDLKAQRLSLRKDASEVVSPGGSVVYTITVENRGQATIYDVLVSDPVPEMVRDVRDISGGGELAGNDRLRWELPQLAAGQLISVTWRGSVVEDLPDSLQTLWNEVSLTSGSGLAAEARAKSLVRRPLLTLEKTATPLAGPGELIYYVLTVRNRGEAPAYDITITDPLPEHLEVVSVSEGGSDQGDAVSWQLAELAPGETVVLDWYGRVARDVPAALTDISSRAHLETPDGSQTEAGAVTRLKRQQVQLVKQASALVHAGGPVSYTLTVENQGEAVLYDLVLADPLPASVQEARVVAATSGAARVEGNQTVVWDIPALAAGNGLTLTWAGVVARDIPAKETEIVNEAGLMSAGGSSARAQAASRLAQPLLTLDKTATLQTGPTGRIDYTLTLANQGSAPAYDVELLDPVPDYLEQVASPDGEIRAEAVRWRFEELAAGAVETVAWTAFVAENIPSDVAEIVNVATARDGAGRKVEAGAVTNLIQPDAPLVTKAATYEVYPGGTVAYTITVRNPSQAPLLDVTVTDPIPDYVENPVVSDGGSTAGGFKVVWQIDQIATGETVSLTWQGTVARSIPAKETEIANQVTVETANGLHRTAQARSYVRQPQLTLDKTATLEAGPGGRIDYTLTLANRGLAPAYDVVVTDSIPNHLERAASPDGEVQAEAVRWRFEKVAAGAVETLTWSAFVAEDIPPNVTEIINLATARDGAGREIGATAVTNLIQPSAPLVTKAATYEVYPGGVVSYTITLRNSGDAALYDVTVTDPIPEYVENPTAISSGGSAAGGLNVIWQIDRIEAGQTLNLAWQGTVARNIPAKETEIASEVVVETANGLHRTAQARSFVRQPQLTLDKTATLEAGPGGQIEYTLTLANRGQAPTYEVTVVDPIPDYLERGASSDGDVRAEAVRWRFAELPAGAVERLTWSAFVAEAVPPDVAEIVNLATARDGAGREVETRAVTNLIQPGAPLVTTAATYDVYPGGTVGYTITVRNPGDAVLYDVTVTDPIPDYVENPTAVSSGGQIEGNSALVWRFDQLTAGETISLIWQGTVARSIPAKETEITNQVVVETANGLRRTAQARSFVRQPQLTLDKTATLEAGPGGRIDYTLTLANQGQAPAYEVELLDPIPEHLERAASPDGEIRAEAVRWRFEKLAAGETHTLTWSAFVAENIPPDVAEIVNLATARDGAGREIGVTAVTDLIQPGAPLVTKAATYEVYPGGVVSYTITLRNSGDAALYDVTVTDPIPDYVENPTAISGGGSAASGLDVIWQIDRIEVGQTVSLTWQGAVARSIPAKETEITSQVTVETANCLRRTAQARSFVRQPQLTLDKTATLEAGPGGRIDYTLTLANRGLAPAYEVELLDPIPEHLEQAASPDGEVQAEAVRWRFAELPAGASKTLTWSAFVAEAVPPDVAEIVNLAIARDGAGREIEASAVTNLIQPGAPLVTKAATYDVYPGGTVAYTVTLRNAGQTALFDLVVTDPIPDYVENPAAVSRGGQIEGNSALVWRLDQLTAGETVSLTWQGTVAASIPAKETEIASEVTVETANGLRRTAQARSFVRQPQLTLDKTATLEAGPGGRIDYTLTLANQGQAPAYEVELLDPIPEHLERAASPDGEVQANAVRWRFAELPAGAVETLTWSAFVAEDVPAELAEIVNVAAVRDGAGRLVEAGAVTNLSQPDAPLLLQEATYRIYPGGVVSYTISLHNGSPQALYDLAVRNPVPTYVLEPTALSAGGRLEGNTALVWQLAALAPGETTRLGWQGQVARDIPPGVGQVTSQVTVETAGGLRSKAQAVSFVQRPRPLIAMAATLSAGPGDMIEYTLQVGNPGQAPAYDVAVQASIPTYILGAASPGGEVGADAVRWRFAELPAGALETLTWSGFVDPDSPATLEQIASTAAIADAAGNRAEATAVTDLPAQMVSLRQAASYEVYPGGTVAYTLTVQNRSQSRLSQITVRQPAPAYVLAPTAISHNGFLAGNLALVWELASLAPGAAETLTWQGTVDPAVPAAETTLLGEATLTSGSGLTAQAQAKSWLRRPQLNLRLAGPTQAAPGERIDYLLTLENSGQAPAYSVEIRNPLPAQVSAPTSPDGTALGDAVVWQIDRLDPGEQRALSWQGEVARDVPASLAEIINRATVRDQAGQQIEAQAVTRLIQPELWLAKTAPQRLSPGGTAVYTLTVSNPGQVPLYDITVSDPLPGALVPPLTVADGGRLQGASLIWQLPLLAPGERRDLHWSGGIDPALPETEQYLWNEATAIAAGGLTARAEARSWLARPLLRLSQLATPESGAGGAVVYTLTVRNDGLAPAYGVTVNDPIPDYVEQTATPDGQVQAGTIRWQFDALAAGQSETLTWRGIVQANAPSNLAEIVNQATATDAAGSMVTAQAATRLLPQRLNLAQAATLRSYPGGTVVYTLTVTNRGAAPLAGVKVRNPIPAGVIDPTSISGNGQLEGNLAVVWKLDTLLVGQSRVLTWRGTIDLALPATVSDIRSEATATTAGGLAERAETRTWLARPLLRLDKLATPENGAGGAVVYTLTVRNDGLAPAYGVTVTDPIPDYVEQAASPAGQVQAEAIRWQVGELAAGQSKTLTWRGFVQADVSPDLSEIVNRATATDAAGSEVTALATTHLLPQRLDLAQTAALRSYPGGTVVYTLTVTNRGAAGLADVIVRNPIPDGVIDPADISDDGQLAGNLAVVWQLNALPAGQSRTLTWQGTVDPALAAAVSDIRSEATATTASGLIKRTETRTWLARPLLRLDKLATSESGAGGLVVYTLTVRNDGLAPAYGVTVNDPIPDYIEQAASPDGQVQAEAIRWQVGALAVGQSKTLTWWGAVQRDTPSDLAEIVNQATASDAAGSEVTAQAATRLLPQKLDLTQAATLRSYPGGTVIYTLTVTNRSVAGLAGVTVRSPIPAGVIDPTNISSGGQLEGNLAVVWNLDALPAGQSRVLTWQGTVDPALPVTVTNIRSEATAETAGGLTERTDTRTWLRRPLLRLDKLATPESGAGGLVVYTLTVRNDGLAPAYGVTVNDPIPDYIEQAASPDGQVQAEAIRWQVGALAAGQSKTLTWQGKIRGDVPSDLTGIVNQAMAMDAAGSAVTAQATTRLLPQKLDLAQAATYQSYPGGTVVYTLTVTNRGAAGLADVIVRNPIPDGLIDPADISGDGRLEGNLAVVWALDALPAGQKRTFTWQGQIDPGLPAAVSDIRSEATATTAGGLIKRTETRTWLARPRLRLDKLALPESGAGGPVVYTLTLRNDGLAPAYEVTVTDPLPDYVVDPTADSEATVQAKAVRWQLGELAAGQSKTLSWRGIVQTDTPASLTEIVNQATATDAAGNEVTAQATTRLMPQKLALAQAATLRSYPGGTVIYTLTVTNRGAAPLAGVTVRSPIPSGVIDPTNISSGGRLAGNLAIVWALDSLPAGQSRTLTWQGMVDPALSTRVTDIRSEATATTAGGLTKRTEARTWLRQPALEIGYTANREAGPGEPVVYQITVKNNGPVPAFDLPLTASIPSYLTNPISAQSGDIRAEAVVWRLDSLAVGESKALSWQGTVAEDVPAGQAQLASSVTASRGEEQRSAQASTWLKAQAVSLAIAAGDPVYPGGVVTYTLVAKNEGQATLYDVQVKNSLPPYVRYLSGGQIDGNQAVTWQLPRLAAAEVVSLTWQGSLAADLPAQVTAVKNEAALYTAGGLTAHAQATSLVVRPRLRLDQTAPFEAGPGEVITYALTVRNLGPAPAYDLRVENPLPAHIIDPAGLSDGGRIAGNLALLWELDSLAAGQSKTLTWRGTVDPTVSERTGQIANRAMVEDGAGHSDEAEAVTTLLERRIDLMGAASLRSYPGGPLVYTLTVRNSGQAALDDITVTNPLPDYVAEPVSDSGQLAGNRAVSWQIPRLAAGERLELGWQAEVARSVPREITEIQSEASLVTGSGLTAQTEMRTVLQHPALLLEKWASRQAGPGEMVDFQLTLRNVGQAPAYDLTLTDPIPAYIVRPTGALSGEVRAEAVVWRLDELPAGQQRTFSWQGQVAETVPDEVRQIGSTASLRDRAGDRAEAEALTWLRRQGVRLLKAASPQIYPGGPAVFTLTVENPGDTTLYGIAVSDPIPDHILGPVAVSEGGQVIGNEAVLWRLPGLAAGEHQTLTWRGTVAKDVPDGVSDIGSDASLTAGGLAASAGATSRLGRPRLILDSRATPQAGPGETVIYTLTVANPGSAPAYAVEVRQPIPDHLLDAGSPTGQVQADAITWRFPELAAGETRTLIWQGRVDSAVPAELAQLGSPATVEDASGQSDTAWAATDLLAQRLHLAQEATPLAGPGGTIAYTLTLRNLGQADLYDLTVSSPRPDHILAPTAISNGGRLAGNRALRWEVARLTSGQVLTLSWQGAVDPVLPADQSDIRSMASVSTRSGVAAEAQARTRLLRPSLRLAALAPATIGPGDLISYTLLVENAGQVPAVGLELRDPIPAAIREPDAISGAGFVDHLPAYAVRWKLGDLGPGQRRTVSWQGRVAPQLLTGTTHLTNSVIAQAAGGVSAEALAQTRLLHPRFELGVLATPQAGPGETIIYTLLLTNSGQIPVRELLVSQPLPDHLTPIETNGALRESDWLNGPLLRWALPSLAVGETRVITWRGRIDLSVPPALGWLDSRVTATASSAGERQATTAIRLQRPQLSLAKRVSPAHVAAGDRLTYTLVVTGSGPVTAFDVTLVDQLPDQVKLLTTGNGGQLQSSALRWWLGDLRPGEVRQVSWQGQLTAAAPLSLAELRSQAVVTAAAGARATAWRSAVVRQPALALSLSGPAWVQPGETVQYGVVLTNTGLAPAYGVRLTDTLPLSTTLLEASGGVVSDGKVVWTLGDLAAGQQQAVKMKVRLEPDLPPEAVLNRAEATAARGLTAQASSAAALRQPQLRLSQQVAGLASPGSLLTYTLRLHNRGDGLARAVVLTNPLPAHLDFVSASPPATLTGRTLRWQPGLLAAGAGFEARWTGRLALALPETAAAITNTAWAGSSDLARPVTATAVLPTLPPQVNTQMICPPTGQVGNVLSYSLRLHNRGGTLLTPTLALTLPPGTVYQPGSATLGGRLATGRRDVWGSPLPDQVQWHLPSLYPDGRLQPQLALTVTSALSDVVWTEAKLTSHGGRSAVHFGCLTSLHTPRLALTKQGPARALVGDVIEWRLSLTNSGRVMAYAPVLTDTLPPGLSYVPGSAPQADVLIRTHPGGDWPETVLRWQAADLPPGESLVRTFRTTVTLPLDLAGYPLTFNAQNEAALENRAAAATNGAAPVTAAHLLLVPRPALTLTRQAAVETGHEAVLYALEAGGDIGLAGPAAQPLRLAALSSLDEPPVAVAAVQAWPGSRIRHTLRGANLGPGLARQATLVEQVPAGLEVLTGTISHGGQYDPLERTISWVLGDLAGGAQFERSYTLAVPLSLRPDLAALEHNRAELKAIEAPAVFAAAATSLDDDLTLAVVKSGPATAAPGAELEYLIRVQNVNRSPLDQVTITDPLPAYTRYLTGSASLPPELQAGGRTMRWNLGMLNSGQLAEVRFKVQVDEDLPDWVLQLHNRAAVTWTGGGPVTAETTSRLPGAALPPTPTPTTTAPPPPGDDGDSGVAPPPPPPPMETPILRTTAVVSPLVTATPSLTPTGIPATAAPPTATPRPQPLLRKTVSTDTVPAGALTVLTWQLTFSNPTPLTIIDLLVRDLLPPGLLYLEAETSRGVVEVSPRSVYGRRARPGVTPTASLPLTPRPTRPSYLTAEQARLVIRPTAATSDTLASPTARVYTVLPAKTVTAATVTATPLSEPVWPGLDLADLPGTADVPPTEVLFRLGDLAPGSRVRMTIRTLVLTDARAGTRYDNVATFAAANMDPGISNRVSVSVVSDEPLFILPVTGGLLELIDPRTAPGKVSWLLLALSVGGLIWYRRRKR